MSNVKSGDLARTVGMRYGPNNDRIVKVLRVAVPSSDGYMTTYTGVTWMCESIGSPLAYGTVISPAQTFVMVRPIDDDLLRPIRDPGDDAQDETLGWLKVPSGEGVTA